MKLDFFTYLPPEIIIDILTRLPIDTIISCKCVCKPWLDLVESPDFVESHRSRSVPGLAIFLGSGRRKPYKIVEFVDKPGRKKYAHKRSRVFNFNFPFDFPYSAYIHSSVNGWLFMLDRDLRKPQNIFVCSPVTRDYVTLPQPSECLFLRYSFGFGVSRATGEYKVVRISQDSVEFDPPECEVYTLGTGSWRGIGGVGGGLMYEGRISVFVNGNLHWLVKDSKERKRISCFDVETELFSIIPSPPNRANEPIFCCFSAFRDCLCLCDNFNDAMVVWMMKEYGNEKSWTKELVIEKPSHRGFLGKFCGFYFLVKVFKNGDVLVAEEDGPGLFCCSKKGRSVQEIDPYGVCSYSHTCTVFYTPSFRSVRMFATENVSSF